LLIAGIKLGPAKKRDAINKVLELVPDWTRGDCWQRIRDLRKTPELAALKERPLGKAKKSGDAAASRRPVSAPWTLADDEWLFNLAGYEPVKRIAQRMNRSVRAVRFRIVALGLSARVTDGWSLRAFMATLRVRHSRVRQLIGSGILGVRDPRITTVSLAAFVEKNRVSLDPAAVERIAPAVAKGEQGYKWERTADLIGASLTEVQTWISAGQLRVFDTFVTDRAFEDFCSKHGDEINMALIDPETAKWLVSEYGVSPSAAHGRSVLRVQKHVLVIRACGCGRKIAGNAYFRHVRICQTTATTGLRDAI
jgi:hypothetical protein